jgi:hypothetical protein
MTFKLDFPTVFLNFMLVYLISIHVNSCELVLEIMCFNIGDSFVVGFWGEWEGRGHAFFGMSCWARHEDGFWAPNQTLLCGSNPGIFDHFPRFLIENGPSYGMARGPTWVRRLWSKAILKYKDFLCFAKDAKNHSKITRVQ